MRPEQLLFPAALTERCRECLEQGHEWAANPDLIRGVMRDDMDNCYVLYETPDDPGVARSLPASPDVADVAALAMGEASILEYKRLS